MEFNVSNESFLLRACVLGGVQGARYLVAEPLNCFFTEPPISKYKREHSLLYGQFKKQQATASRDPLACAMLQSCFCCCSCCCRVLELLSGPKGASTNLKDLITKARAGNGMQL
jgi:hypothetical protein